MEYDMKKMLLHKLIKFRREGHWLTQLFDMNSSIEELQFEVDRIKYQIQKEDEISLYRGFLRLSESFKEQMDNEQESSDDEKPPDDEEESEKKEILKKLQELRDEGFDVKDCYTLDVNVEDLRLRLKRYTKLYQEGISPNDYYSESVFSTIDPNDKEKMEKSSQLLIREMTGTISKNISKELPENKKIMHEAASNFIDGFCDKFVNEEDTQTTKAGLKTLAALLLSNSKC
jgi:hypothetical protein